MRLPGLFDGLRAPLVVALIALIAAGSGIFSMPVLDRDEARFAQATAQMIETGDLIEISFLDEPRNKKPVGIHWLQAMAVAATTGEDAREIWAYRVPSVLGAVLAALATFFAGARLFGNRVGFAAACMISVSVLLATEGGIAKTDSMLGATCALTFLAIAILRTSPSPGEMRWAALLFWISLGVGALTKGPVTPMAGFLAIVLLIVLECRVSWTKPLIWWPGPVLSVAIVLPWLIAIQIATDGAFLLEAVGDDMGTKVVTGDEGHDGPPGYHLVLIAVLFAPAILTLPAGLRAILRHWRQDTRFAAAARTVIAFALPTWLVFELLPTKLPHYTLPTYAALGLIAGLGLVGLRQTPALWRWLGAVLGLLGYVVATPGILGFAVVLGDLHLVPALVTGLVISLFALGAILATGLGKPATVLTLAIIAGLSWHIGLRGMLSPNADAFFVSRDTAEVTLQVRAQVSGAETFSTFTEPSFVFDVGGDVDLIDPADLSVMPIDPSAPRVYVIDESRWLQGEGGPLSAEDEAIRTAWLVALQEATCTADAAQGRNYSRGDDRINVFVFATGCGAEPAPDQTETPEVQP